MLWHPERLKVTTFADSSSRMFKGQCPSCHQPITTQHWHKHTRHNGRGWTASIYMSLNVSVFEEQTRWLQFQEINSFGWYNDTVKNSSITTKHLYLILTISCRMKNIASHHSPTMRIKQITQSTGKRLRSSTENKTVLPGGSRKLYISARKVIELWVEMRAVISWVTPTTAFLMRQLIVASRLGKTEYQLLVMKISWWDRNVKIRYKCLVDEFLTETRWLG